jgi:alpha-glucosidase
MLAFSRTLLHWRRTQPLLRTGGIRFIDAPEPLLHFERRDGKLSLRAVFNLGSEPVSMPLPDGLMPLVGQPLEHTAVMQTVDGKRMLTLAPYGVFFGTPAVEGRS